LCRCFAITFVCTSPRECVQDADTPEATRPSGRTVRITATEHG